MSTLSRFRATAGRTVLVLVLAGVVGSVAAAPARAEDDRGRGRHEGEWRGQDRDRGEWRGHGRERREREWRERPVYVPAPPPVVYAPPPPTGLELIFPIHIR